MVFRFIDNCRGTKIAGYITVDEFEGAHNEWIKQVQENMKKEKHYHQWAKAMGLFQDTQGLVRSRGRFERAELEYDAKYPLLLPADHRLTLLLIRKAHEEVYHNGVT